MQSSVAGKPVARIIFASWVSLWARMFRSAVTTLTIRPIQYGVGWLSEIIGDDTERIMRCPSIGGGAYFPNWFGSGGSSRQPCLGLASNPTNGPIRESAVKAPSEMIGIVDFYFPLLPPLVQAGGPVVPLPHSGGIQFLLCDGHVGHKTAVRFADSQMRRRWNNDNQPHDETW